MNVKSGNSSRINVFMVPNVFILTKVKVIVINNEYNDSLSFCLNVQEIIMTFG